MAEDLTVENFVENIKKMSDRDRKKIRWELLIDLIIQVADVEKLNQDKVENYTKLETCIAALEAQYTYIKTDTINNTASILNIKNEKQNPVTQATAENTDKIKDLELEIKDMKKHLNGIEQYLRVNNLEIIGLDEVKDGDFESNEERILAAINSLEFAR